MNPNPDLNRRLRLLGTGTAGLIIALPVAMALGRAKAPAEPGASAPTDNGQLATDDHTITFTASDATLDRYDEIIMASGWKLESYRRNPVFQADHYYSIEATIGRALETTVVEGKLRQVIQFAVGLNPMADFAYKMYRAGFLNAVSVGFIPLRWENGSEQSGFRRRYLEQELLELSAVAIPANPNALQDALDEGAIDKSLLTEVERLVRALAASADGRAVLPRGPANPPLSASPGTLARASGSPAHDAHHAELIRGLASLQQVLAASK
jgi:HK97 family phage prohead protease